MFILSNSFGNIRNGKLYGFSPFTYEIYPLAFRINKSFPTVLPCLSILKFPCLSNTSDCLNLDLPSLTFIKFSKNTISLKLLNIGVADIKSNLSCLTRFTKTIKFLAIFFFGLSPVIRIL